MNRYIIICAVALTTLSLQPIAAEVVDKKVTVTRAYTPTVEEATKLTLIPDTSDNTYIKPDIDYTITPISIGTTFMSELYSPTQISFGEYDRPERFYVKAGIGYPLNSVVDIYASSLKSSKGYALGYVNQDGRFADIENDYGVKSSASQNHLRVGAAGGLYLGRRTLGGSLNYNLDRWSRYATSTLYDTNPLYQDIEFKGRYGDDFADLERLNFAIGADAKYFWSRSDFNSTTLGVNGSLGYHMLKGDVLFSAGFSAINGGETYGDNTLFLSLGYKYSSDKLGFGVGLKFYNDNIDCDSEGLDDSLYSGDMSSETDGATNYAIPMISFDYKLKEERLIVYLDVDGEIRHNDFASLSGVNPYLLPGLSLAKSSAEYDIDFGLKGRIANNKLGYNIYVGFTQITNNLYWAYCEQSTEEDNTNNYFVASYSNQHNINLNAELEYQPISDLSLQLAINHANYNNDDEQQFADGMSDTKLRFDGRYSVGKMGFGLNAELLSSRECSQIISNTLSVVEIPTRFDMGLSVDYKHSDRFVIFADVDNIFNSDIYNWLHYREYGINFVAGVKIQF